MILSACNDTVVSFCKITGDCAGRGKSESTACPVNFCTAMRCFAFLETFSPLPTDWSWATLFLLLGSVDRKLSKDIFWKFINTHSRKAKNPSHLLSRGEGSITLIVSFLKHECECDRPYSCCHEIFLACQTHKNFNGKLRFSTPPLFLVY